MNKNHADLVIALGTAFFYENFVGQYKHEHGMNPSLASVTDAITALANVELALETDCRESEDEMARTIAAETRRIRKLGRDHRKNCSACASYRTRAL